MICRYVRGSEEGALESSRQGIARRACLIRFIRLAEMTNTIAINPADRAVRQPNSKSTESVVCSSIFRPCRLMLTGMHEPGANAGTTGHHTRPACQPCQLYAKQSKGAQFC